MALFAFAAGSAQAEVWCSLSVSNSYVPIGTSYSYDVNVTQAVYPGPWPPGGNYMAPFSFVFYGSKNGVADIPPSGEVYPGPYPYGHTYLTGYYNPGGYEGTYLRYAVILDKNGGYYCTTNTVAVVLE
jgi:hypothetical protein